MALHSRPALLSCICKLRCNSSAKPNLSTKLCIKNADIGILSVGELGFEEIKIQKIGTDLMYIPTASDCDVVLAIYPVVILFVLS